MEEMKKTTGTEAAAAQHDYSSIAAVPAEARHISFSSMALTWGGISLQPATWTVCGSMICAGLFMGIFAMLLGASFGLLLTALFGYMTFRTGLSSMGMTRPTLGVRGTKLVTVATILNSIGWVTVTGYLAAITISYIFKLMLGTPAVGEPGSAPIMILSCMFIVALEWLAIARDGSRTLKLFQTIMMIALIVFCIAIFVVLLRIVSWKDLRDLKIPDGMRMTFAQCFDTYVAGTITVAIFGGDLARYAVKKSTAKYACFAGALPALLAFGLMAILGIVASYVSTGVFSLSNANPSTLATSLGLGIPALLIVLFSTITTSMLDIYSIANSLTNLCEGWNYKKASLVAGAASLALCWIPVVTTDFLTYFFAFIDVLGAVFPPLIVILLVDYYVVQRQQTEVGEITKAGGRYWFTNGYNIAAIVSWLIGAVVYFILNYPLKSDHFSNVLLSMLITVAVYLLAVRMVSKK